MKPAASQNISELTASFTDELLKQKIVLNSDEEILHAVNDLLVRVQSYRKFKTVLESCKPLGLPTF